MKKNKSRFIILGSIVFLVSLLTFIISGLANGLSQDNAALIKDMPEGQFYMEEDADETYNLSKIEEDTQESVAFVTSTESDMFENVEDGEIILDSSLKDKGIEVGDTLTNNQFSDDFTVKGFVDEKKFSHSPVAYINMENYQEMYRTMEMQMLFVPGQDQAQSIDGLQAFSNKDFLDTIPSYSAEQLSLNMIVWFLVVISGML